MQTGAVGTEIDGIDGIDGIGIIAAIGLYIGNGGGNNGNLLRETEMELKNYPEMSSTIFINWTSLLTIFCVIIGC